MPKSKVSLVNCPSYNINEVYDSVKRSIDLVGGVDSFRKYGKKVLLKPNILCGAKPEEAVTTHPAVVEAVARLFHENNFEVTVGDSPAIDSTLSAASKCGIADGAARAGVTMSDFKFTVEKANPDGVLVKKFTIAKACDDADFIVSIPKLKTHSQMYYTGAMKNMFGAISGLQKSKFHVRFVERLHFAKMIIDLNALLKPRLAVVDAVVSMEGHGPRNGTPKHTGFVAASADLCALDYTCASLIGYNAAKIPIIAEGFARGIYGSFEPSDIELCGDTMESLKPQSFELVEFVNDIAFARKYLPRHVYNILRNAIIPAPAFNAKKCILCGKCVKICSAEALQIVSNKKSKGVHIDLSRCIRCYCCHEVCPARAIDLKRYFKM
jgi:uncharacterized protein (DUF362 family)/Pyruvate/2-oxoacid:ferredoxin oxidoreductase delta subunit